ncbi:hypothetical protein SDC9_197979 [bioreactor metagenome]|uniref:Uncharacterized protein n=1 Tax=bioreactor metagenome TaxID=1076179 RepID=A0A645IT74_9ZZZZ
MFVHYMKVGGEGIGLTRLRERLGEIHGLVFIQPVEVGRHQPGGELIVGSFAHHEPGDEFAELFPAVPPFIAFFLYELYHVEHQRRTSSMKASIRRATVSPALDIVSSTS